jgi:cob(I)alamin adenosyltransferase
MKKGLVHIYTGHGKGKSTAAFGLAIRAAGAGLRVLILQFIKGKVYSELKTLGKIPRITVTQCGRGCFIRRSPRPADIACALNGLDEARSYLTNGLYDLVVLDEINCALDVGLVKTADVVSLIRERRPSVEMVLTGRSCPKSLYRYADYVTEMREVKHPYRRGIQARKGIEH